MDSLPPFFGGFGDGTPGLNGRRGSKRINGLVICPPLITAPSKKLIGVLLVQVLAAAVSLVAVVTCVCDDARLKMPDMFFLLI